MPASASWVRRWVLTGEPIELQLNPCALPTAQHRAGLAGLLVLTESLRRRRLGPPPEISTGGDGAVGVRLTRHALQVLLDDLYDAFWDERKSPKQPLGTSLRKVRRVQASQTEEGEGQRGATYTFETVAPRGAFLQALGMPEPWLKLWREAVWSTLRGIPMTRTPYRQRLAGQHVREAGRVWSALQRGRGGRGQARSHAGAVTGSLFLGAQAANAERVPFRGRADEAFLLHFWPVVMGVYVPEVLDRQGQARFVGYVLAAPDISDLGRFCQSFMETVAHLGAEVAGFRPRGAIISLPQEGALEYLHHLLALATGKAQEGETEYSVAGVEVYHLAKRGRRIQVLATQRLAASRRLLQDYDAIRGRYRDPLFKRQVLLNLLRGEPWYQGFDLVFAQNDSQRFVGARADRFASDAQRGLGRPVPQRRSS